MFRLSSIGVLVTILLPGTEAAGSRLFWMAPRNDNLDMLATEIAGGCLCGIVRYRLTNTPRVHYCHCDMCRRATGSAFAVLAWTPVDALFWTSGRPKYRRSSPLAERGFCENCGTPLTLTYHANQGELTLHAGTWTHRNVLSRATIMARIKGSVGCAAA